MNLLTKMRGDGAARPARPGLRPLLVAASGGTISAGLLAWLTLSSGCPLLLGSFGATIVLLFCLPDAPVAQPRHVIGGHLISAACGLVFLHFVGSVWWCRALAVGVSNALMMLTGTLHPPGGANTIIVYLTKPTWAFLLFPTLTGTLLLLLFALIYNNLTRAGRYPKYW